MDEAGVLARFNRRLAGIEADVKDGSANELPRRAIVTRPIGWRSGPARRRTVLPLLVAIALLVVAIGVIRPLAAGPVPSAGPLPSQPAVGASASPSADLGVGPARLRIQGYEMQVARPDPSGITIAPAVTGTLHFRVAVTSQDDAETLTIAAVQSWRELDLTPGSYEVDASVRTEILDLDNGRNIIGVPGGPCVIRLDLAPGTTTLLAVTDVYGQACGFSQRLVDAPTSWPPSSAPSSPPPGSSRQPKSLISKSRAIDLADEEAPSGASYESISAGPFSDLQVTPPWSGLDRYFPPTHMVWAAHFADATPGCSSPGWCGETVVYLDDVSGAFLLSVHLPAKP
jgi:hypothetical protein